MGILQWKPEYEIGVKEIDAQHKAIFTLYNKQLSHLIAGEEHKNLSLIIHELTTLIITHFDSEEELMLKTGYSEYENHKLEHLIIREELKNLIMLYDIDRVSLPSKIQEFSRMLIDGPLKESDYRFGEYLKSINYNKL